MSDETTEAPETGSDAASSAGSDAAARPARASGAARAAAKSTKPRTAKPASARAPAASRQVPADGQASAESAPPKPAAKRPVARKPAAKPATDAAAESAPAAKSASPRKPSAPRKPTAARKPAAPQKPTAATPVAEPEVLAEPEVVVEPEVLVEPVAVLEPEPAAVEPEPVAVVEPEPAAVEPVLVLEGLTKRFGDTVAVDEVTLTLDPGTFTGIVGPNGAGKTTTLSMVTGLLRPTSGRVLLAGVDVWREPRRAKRQLGVLPDRLHTFDRLTGGQLLYYTGVLHGLDRLTARSRTIELAEAFKVEHAMGRLVTDYSSGMLKKIALAAALVHAPRLLVLDEPFESVDPVSAMTVAQILRDFAAAGGTVLMSSHSMELVERICDHVAVIVDGRLIAGGTVDEVRGNQSLQERFIDLAGAEGESIADLTWLHRFSG